MNTNFYTLWFDLTGIRTRVYRFSSRRSIHSTTDQLKHFIKYTLRMSSQLNLLSKKAPKYLTTLLVSINPELVAILSSANSYLEVLENHTPLVFL